MFVDHSYKLMRVGMTYLDGGISNCSRLEWSLQTRMEPLHLPLVLVGKL